MFAFEHGAKSLGKPLFVSRTTGAGRRRRPPQPICQVYEDQLALRARAAQVGYVQSVGVEVAPHNVQVNLIAQNYVENPVYYPEPLRENERFQASLKRQVPLGRLARAQEDAQFALFLAGEESDFFVGQAIPFTGGWVQR